VRSKSIGWILAALLTCTRVELASAHHSFAAFDTTKQFTLSGVVKEFQWTNPHCWLYLSVTNANGQSEDWQLEALSPNVLGRLGWKKNSVKPGDKVVVLVNPTRDGSHGGALISLTDASGNKIGGRNP
jgi:Family of unknown function (DUF6152)